MLSSAFLSIAESYKPTNRTIEKVFGFSPPFVGEFSYLTTSIHRKGISNKTPQAGHHSGNI